MRKIIEYIVIMHLLIVSSLNQILFAENPDSVNHAFVGVDFGYLNVSQRGAYLQDGDAYCPKLPIYASGNGFYSGINLKYNIEHGNESINSVLLKVCMSNMNTISSIVGDSYSSINTGGDTIINETFHAADIKYVFLNTDLLYQQRIFRKLPINICLGLSFSIPVYTNFYQTYNLKNGNSKFPRVYNSNGSLKYRYLNNDRTVVIYDDEIKLLNNYIIGVKSSLSYEISISDNIIISPEIGYYYRLTRIVKDAEWWINYTNAGINIYYRIKP